MVTQPIKNLTTDSENDPHESDWQFVSHDPRTKGLEESESELTSVRNYTSQGKVKREIHMPLAPRKQIATKIDKNIYT